ncbi:MAG: hypothetical protein HKO57_05575, partial [Akkermansiaceae bacterium]|nr:hypothetical protein [Akkermansiaceae bacterium]
MASPRHNRTCLAVCVVALAAGAGSAAAQWKQTSGFNALNAFLDGVGVPDGSGVLAGQVEALEGGYKYLPHAAGAGTGTNFTGKVITDVTGVGGDVSGHSRVVGYNFFGNVRSICTGLVDAHCWSAGDFIDNVLKVDNGQVAEFAPDVGNFSWAIASDLDPVFDGTDICRRLDHLINQSGFIAMVGTTNDTTAALPEAMVPCYNVISVGRSTGVHAAGFTPLTRDGPGRIKPEIVVEHDLTSWSTAAASSMAAALHSAAPAAAQRSEVMKAIIMAGATKEEVASWDKTASRPLDDVYGAGLMNVFHSYRILVAGNQAPGVVPRRGWDLLSLGSLGSATYTFTIDPSAEEGEFSLMATWNRTLTYADPPGPRPGAYNPDLLPNVDLQFHDGATIIQESSSPVDNVEHIYFPSLPPGTYTLTVNTDLPAEVGIAWRTELKQSPRVTRPSVLAATIGLDDLVTGAEYDIERSLTIPYSWSQRDTVTAPGAFMDWTDPSPPAGGKAYYRLNYG